MSVIKSKKTTLLSIGLVLILIYSLISYWQLNLSFNKLTNQYSTLDSEYDDLSSIFNSHVSSYNLLLQENRIIEQAYEEINNNYIKLEKVAIERHVEIKFIAFLAENIQYWYISNLTISIPNTEEYYKNVGIMLYPKDNTTEFFSLKIPIYKDQENSTINITYHYSGSSIHDSGGGIAFTFHYNGWKTEILTISEDTKYFLEK
jgi:hypothetical protein